MSSHSLASVLQFPSSTAAQKLPCRKRATLRPLTFATSPIRKSRAWHRRINQRSCYRHHPLKLLCLHNLRQKSEFSWFQNHLLRLKFLFWPSLWFEWRCNTRLPPLVIGKFIQIRKPYFWIISCSILRSIRCLLSNQCWTHRSAR